MYIIILQGAYVGASIGFVLTITIAIGGMIYSPDKMVGSISVKECDFYNGTIQMQQLMEPKQLMESYQRPSCHIGTG
jgi:hypothetical protein